MSDTNDDQIDEQSLEPNNDHRGVKRRKKSLNNNPKKVKITPEEMQFVNSSMEEYTNIRIIDELGSGSFGIVYRVITDLNGNKVEKAMKFTRDVRNRWRDGIRFGNMVRSVMSSINIGDLTQHLSRETEVLFGLKHQNILSMIDYLEMPSLMTGLSHSSIIILTEVMTGTLKDLSQRKAWKRTDHIIHWTRQLANGIQFLHHNNVVHLDIKFDNVLFKCEGNKKDMSKYVFKLADFGLARKYPKGVEPEVLNIGLKMAIINEPQELKESFGQRIRCRPLDIYGFGMTILCFLDINLVGMPYLLLAEYWGLDSQDPDIEFKKFVLTLLGPVDERPDIDHIVANDLMKQ